MKLKIISLLSILFLCSCGSVKNLLKKSEVHEKMATQLETQNYTFTLAELQTKLIGHLEYTGLGGKMIILNSNNTMGMHNEKVREEMEDGFLYKDKMYVSTPDFNMDLFTSDFEKLKDKLLKAKYHILEKSEQGFLMVKGNTVYEATVTKDNPNQCALRVFKVTKLVRPIDLNIDWLNIIKKKGSFFNFSEGPIDFVASRKYQVRDRMEELNVFFRIDQERAEKTESELMATL